MSYDFNTPAGQTIARELLIACLNTGTKAVPVWSIVGTRVEDSSTEYDWNPSSKRDIVGKVHGSMRKPILTQSFDPCELDSGESALTHVWQLAVVDQDAQALANQDMLIIHSYAGFAERYESCMVVPKKLGGEGGGDIGMPIDVTYGGTRTVGTATNSNGTITFTPES